ncbi:MAG: hypothetical protein KC413_19445, partial [Anaerolineales bacterium]|nr:hypothetical protein [Anaerolineales bacterium]
MMKRPSRKSNQKVYMNQDEFDLTQYPDLLGIFDTDEFNLEDLDDTEDGVIDCPFLPLRDVVLFPQMVMPLF